MLRRLRVTPVPAAAVAIAHGVTAVMTGFLSLIVLMTLARLIFGMQMAGSWLALVSVYLCGACAWYRWACWSAARRATSGPRRRLRTCCFFR